MATSAFSKQVLPRLLVLLVFISNMYCAVVFVLHPEAYISSYQLSGEGAAAAISGFGILFAMWSVTYILLIVFPYKFKAVFPVVIAQHIIGIMGETSIYLGLGQSQEILAASIFRFIVFDSVGLVLLILAAIFAIRR